MCLARVWETMEWVRAILPRETAMERIYRSEYRDGNLVASRDPEKAAILSFFSEAEPKAAAAGYFNDAVTGETMYDMEYLGYTDGDFTWSTKDVYHFERYDLELLPSFREHALAQRLIARAKQPTGGDDGSGTEE